VITVVSPAGRDADMLDEYRGLARRRPWLAAVFTGALLSLAGIPLTAGFIGKFLVLDAGAGAGLWTLTVLLALNSGLGLFYYLRVVAAMFGRPAGDGQAAEPASFPAVPLAGGAVLAATGLALIALGVYPDPLIRVVKLLVAGLF
jgi:NADH-quinone oxidoreductase subunit N